MMGKKVFQVLNWSKLEAIQDGGILMGLNVQLNVVVEFLEDCNVVCCCQCGKGELDRRSRWCGALGLGQVVHSLGKFGPVAQSKCG
eukprot:217036-Ditylum_brightwellii.AAC.1